jgi:two-component system response regulator FimZ (fimbrial Z protein)
MINISIADNQPVVMHGIKCFFKSHLDISISDTIYHLKDIHDSLINKKVNILIIDIELEGLQSINSLKKIIQEHPHTKILIYTCASEKLFGATSLKAGVAGFISKNDSLKNVEQAVLTIAEGRTNFSDSVHKSILSAARINRNDRLYRKLSTRESEVLMHLIDGKKNNEISEILNLNEKTISSYKQRLLYKLDVTNLIDLISKAKTLEMV